MYFNVYFPYIKIYVLYIFRIIYHTLSHKVIKMYIPIFQRGPFFYKKIKLKLIKKINRLVYNISKKRYIFIHR